MQLKAHTYYRTRDGQKAYVVGQSPFNKGEWVVIHKCGIVDIYYDAGETSGEEPDDDLVEEWREPHKRTIGSYACLGPDSTTGRILDALGVLSWSMVPTETNTTKVRITVEEIE